MSKIEELEAEIRLLKSQLARCFRGETQQVRNEMVLEKIKGFTESVLASDEDLKEYLDRRYD